MNQRTLAITAILAASILSVVVISTPMAFADESETVIEQEERQENVLSDESFNDNCSQNLIDSAAVTACATIGAGGITVPGEP